MEKFYTDIKSLEAALGDRIYLVLSDNLRGIFSLGVKIRKKGSYGHMMWKVPKYLASQTWTFRRMSLEHYAGCTMKFIYNPKWTKKQQQAMLTAIEADLDLPWYKRVYDVPAIVGQAIGWDWLQYGKAMICSERIIYLRYVDPEVDEWLKLEKTPDPTDVNAFTKARQDRYKVFARYSPD